VGCFAFFRVQLTSEDVSLEKMNFPHISELVNLFPITRDNESSHKEQDQ